MSDDKMRQEFEAWAKAAAYDLSQTTDDKYWCVATISAWQVWQVAYAAGQKAERKAIEAKLRREIDHAACNAMRIEPMFGQSKGDLAVRVSTLEAIIENRESE